MPKRFHLQSQKSIQTREHLLPKTPPPPPLRQTTRLNQNPVTSGTESMQLVWVERPTWPFAAATCRRAGRTETAHHLVGGVVRSANCIVPAQRLSENGVWPLLVGLVLGYCGNFEDEDDDENEEDAGIAEISDRHPSDEITPPESPWPPRSFPCA